MDELVDSYIGKPGFQDPYFSGRLVTIIFSGETPGHFGPRVCCGLFWLRVTGIPTEKNRFWMQENTCFFAGIKLEDKESH